MGYLTCLPRNYVDASMKYMLKNKKRKLKIKKFWLLIPVFLIIAAFVFFKSTLNQNPVLSGCRTLGFSGEYDSNDQTGFVFGKEISVPHLADISINDTKVLGVANPSERWIEVDLSEQKLRAWDGSSLFLETSVSSGLPWWPTPKGEFRIWIKMRFTKMEGGEGRYYYNLPNVPYVMFFEGSGIPGYLGYGLHGTYWHNAFGTQRSHGCVNLPTDIAGKLFYWTTPSVSEGKWAVRATDSDPGTRIVIHE